MSNIILATPDLSDAATITGSLALGDMSLQNLKEVNLFKKYRTENLSPQINIDFGSAKAINFAALVAHNATDSATVTIKAGATSAVSDFTSGALDMITGSDNGADRKSFSHFFASQTYRYWRFEISDTGNPDAFLEAGRMYLSNAFQPATNAIYGMEEGFSDESRVARTVSGGVSTVVRDPFQVAAFELDFTSKQEMFAAAFDIDKNRGKAKDVIFIPDIEDATYFQKRFLYGKFNEMNPIIHASFNIFRKRYRIEEIK